MKRLCGHCQKTLGEKCIECGSENVAVVVRDGPFTVFKCLDCSHKWHAGDDPETTGLCQECFAAQAQSYERSHDA